MNDSIDITTDVENSVTTENVVSTLRRCDDEYFNGSDPIMSDREYDILKRRAFLSDPNNEYFLHIGSDIRSGKTKLPYVMGSLNQIYENEIQGWFRKYNLSDSDIVVTDKLDGVSCLLIYNNENLSICYSRGNGVEGADITRHIKHISNVPKMLAGVEYLAIRAEVIMKNDIFHEKYSTKYKNPRNMVAGVLNRKETEKSILDDLNVVVYEILAGTINGVSDYNRYTKHETLKVLVDLGFTVVNNDIVNAKDISDSFLTAKFLDVRKNSVYELDGIVLTVNDHTSLVNKSTSTSLNPEHSVKYKVLDENSTVETYVKNVHWEISKSGFLKPRIEIQPVELFGTTVTYATGFNAKYIRDNLIRPMTKVKITKAGMVIPQIVCVIHDTMEPQSIEDYNMWFDAQINSLLGTENWGWTPTNVDIVMVDLMNNDSVIFKQVLSFFETYKIELLRESNLLEVLKIIPSSAYDDIICDICDLAESEWVRVLGVNGSKIYSSMRNRISNSQPETFLGACRYMGVGFGVRRAKALLSGVHDVCGYLEHLSMGDIIEKDGFDEKTAMMVLKGIPPTIILMTRLIDNGVLKFSENSKSDEMAGINVVMTGFRDEELQKIIESMGGNISSGVSKKTTCLLCIDKSSETSKAQKARALGIDVLTPDEFRIKYRI